MLTGSTVMYFWEELNSSTIFVSTSPRPGSAKCQLEKVIVVGVFTESSAFFAPLSGVP